MTPIEIRHHLRNWVYDKFELSDNDILIDELGFVNKHPTSTIDNTYRADLVLANGRLVGFEIKSKKDTLKRWEQQKNAYTNVFDEVWLCVHNKHLQQAMDVTQKHIGIILTDDYGGLAVVRVAKEKHGLNNIYDMSGLLWREEIDELLKIHNIIVKSRTTKKEVREMLAEHLSLEQVRDFVLQKIKLRKANLGN